jgi:uncharacterized lipoprotein YbaY
MSNNEPQIQGQILFEETQSFCGATVYVRLEDVSQADAPSRVAGEQVIHNVSRPPGRPRLLPINLRSEMPKERSSYVVRVHVDVDGDGQVSRGDYITMESYPVLTFGHPNWVTVRVHEVE